MKIMEQVAGYFFRSKPYTLHYLLPNGTYVVTTPLVMTQTLKKIASPLPAKNYLNTLRATRQGEVVLLWRPEVNRLVSAFNKKVIPLKKTYAKKKLLQSTGLKFDLTFDEFIDTLIERQEKGLFIDRHFLPQRLLLAPYLGSLPAVEIGSPEFGKIFASAAEIKEKSSQEIAGKARLHASEVLDHSRSKAGAYVASFDL